MGSSGVELDVEEESRCVSSEFLSRIKDGAAAAASEENYARWKLARDEVSPRHRAPISVRTVTCSRGMKGAGRHPGRKVPAVVEKRPVGRRFGALVHSMLAAIDLNCTRADIDNAAALHGRMINATQEEIEAAATTVVRRVEPSPHAQGCSHACGQFASGGPDHAAA